MTALSAFRAQVMIEAPGAPTPLVDREVRHAAIEFCEYTRTWQLEVDAKDYRLDPDDVIYEYQLPDDARILTLIFVPAGCGRSINEQSGCGASWYYTAEDTKAHITLLSETAALDGLQFALSFKPTQTASTLPANLYNDNLEAIGNGALARLLAMPGKAWSNPQLAAYYKSEFERAKRKEKAEVLNAYTRYSTLSIGPGALYN